MDRNLIGPLIFNVQPVALRKESVDRNMECIEKRDRAVVALRKESVDRNLGTVQIVIIVVGRSPQGERG